MTSATYDLADLQRKVRAARTRHVKVAEGVTIELLLPTEHEVDVASVRAGMPAAITVVDAKAAMLQMLHALVVGAVAGWQGVCVRHILASEAEQPAGAEPVEYSADVVPMLLDAQPEWASQLQTALMDARESLQQVVGDAEKN